MNYTLQFLFFLSFEIFGLIAANICHKSANSGGEEGKRIKWGERRREEEKMKASCFAVCLIKKNFATAF